MKNETTLTHGSLFSGIGGFELAAEWAGFKNVFNCEIDPFCRKVLDYYFPNSIGYEDIKTTDFSQWRGKIDILTGGFPCQPFSVAGHRKGADDDRYLWPQMFRAIREIKPTWVIAENVAGIKSMVQPGETINVENYTDLFGENYTIEETEHQYVLETICRDLEREGYSVQSIVIPACAVGAPHRRDRIWIVAQNSEYIRCNCSKSEEKSNVRKQRKFSPRNYVRICREKRITSNCTNTRIESVRKQEVCANKDGATPNASKRYKIRTENETIQRMQNNRFTAFPTQSPICGGNDGIPAELDGISIPAWRRESIKAYGNAIVPHVAYEIFKAVLIEYI